MSKRGAELALEQLAGPLTEMGFKVDLAPYDDQANPDTGPAAVYPGTAKFIADFKAKFNADPQPFAAQSYDSMAIGLKAIEDAARASNGEIPNREAVAKAVRALKEFPGITGTFTFNEIGDPEKAQYFVIQVKSADPNAWSSNEVVQTLDIAPPQ